MAVGQPGGPRRRMQVEAHRELVAAGGTVSPFAGVKVSSPSSRWPSSRAATRAGDHIEGVGIAVVRRAQHDAVGLLLARDVDLARAADHRRAVEHALDRARFDEAAMTRCR